MKLVIFGANGQTGRILTAQALAEGHAVTAFTRHPDAFPLRHAQLRVVGGDVHDPAAVEAAVAGHDAVLSVLGVPYSNRPITIYSRGVVSIVEAMRRQGLRRLVCVSSTAVDPGYDTGGGVFFRRVLTPLITRTLGRTTYVDQRQMETLVTESGLDWTIVRPSGLFGAPAVSPYQVNEGRVTGRFTSRTDLADLLLRLATSDRYVGRPVAVATVSGQPNLITFLRKEAIGKKAA